MKGGGEMFKKVLVVLIVAVLIGLVLNIKWMYAQKNEETKSTVDYEQILDKLDQILENQTQMKEDIYIIRQRV